MSNTRHATDGAYHQSRYASSPEFHAGLAANLVAKRNSVELVPDKKTRELIWFVQYLSHQPGGLRAVARDIIGKYSGRMRTQKMAALQIQCGHTCNAEQTRQIRKDMPFAESCQFPLQGDFSGDDLLDVLSDFRRFDDSGKHPDGYPAIDFFASCQAAASEPAGLEKYLADFCLDPALGFNCGPCGQRQSFLSTGDNYSFPVAWVNSFIFVVV